MKNTREQLDILNAYRELGSYRAAARLCRTTDKTVKRVVQRLEAGGPYERRPRRLVSNTESVKKVIEKKVKDTDGLISAKRLLPVVRAAGYQGSARNLRRAVAEAKARWRRQVLGRSGYTLRSYRLGLVDFGRWLADEGLALAAVRRRHIEAYVGKFGLERAATTVNHRLSVLASFFAFLIRPDTEAGDGAWAGRTSPVPAQADPEVVLHRMAGRDAPVRRCRAELRRRPPRRLPRDMDPDVAEQLIREAGSWRDRAILLLLTRTGQWVGDCHPEHGRHGVLGMRLADFDRRRSTITVRLKGAGDEHRVPVTGDFWPVFDRYFAEERGDPPTDAAWVGHRRGSGKPLRYSAFEAALRYLADRLGVRVTAYMFRHSLAQQVYETAGVKVAQEILGDKHLSTTADTYAHIDQTTMVAAIAGVEARRHAKLAIPQAQLMAGQRYAFAYDASTIAELEAVAACQIVGEAGDA